MFGIHRVLPPPPNLYDTAKQRLADIFIYDWNSFFENSFNFFYLQIFVGYIQSTYTTKPRVHDVAVEKETS